MLVSLNTKRKLHYEESYNYGSSIFEINNYEKIAAILLIVYIVLSWALVSINNSILIKVH